MFRCFSNRAIRFARFGSPADPDSNRAHRDTPTQNPEIPKKHRVYKNFFEKFPRAFAFFQNCLQCWKKGKDPHPQDKMQHLVFTKDPQPLYYNTPPCAFYHKNVRSKAAFAP